MHRSDFVKSRLCHTNRPICIINQKGFSQDHLGGVRNSTERKITFCLAELFGCIVACPLAFPVADDITLLRIHPLLFEPDTPKVSRTVAQNPNDIIGRPFRRPKRRLVGFTKSTHRKGYRNASPESSQKPHICFNKASQAMETQQFSLLLGALEMNRLDATQHKTPHI